MVSRVAFVLACVAVSACQGVTAPRASCFMSTGSAQSQPGPWVDVKFVESLQVRVCDGVLGSRGGANLSGLKAILTQVGVIQIDPLFSIDSAAYVHLIEDAERLSGESEDLLSWHRLSFASNADLDVAVSQLLARPEVEYAYVVSDYVPPPP
jgi:hypothetical protein